MRTSNIILFEKFLIDLLCRSSCQEYVSEIESSIGFWMALISHIEDEWLKFTSIQTHTTVSISMTQHQRWLVLVSALVAQSIHFPFSLALKGKVIWWVFLAIHLMSYGMNYPNSYVFWSKQAFGLEPNGPGLTCESWVMIWQIQWPPIFGLYQLSFDWWVGAYPSNLD